MTRLQLVPPALYTTIVIPTSGTQSPRAGIAYPTHPRRRLLLVSADTINLPHEHAPPIERRSDHRPGSLLMAWQWVIVPVKVLP
jgi:hypothetical protein